MLPPMLPTFILIPARAGSVRFPHKNIASFPYDCNKEDCPSGNTLLGWAIDTARTMFDDNEIIVSSDSDEYLDEAVKGDYRNSDRVVLHKRAAVHATPTATTAEVILAVCRDKANLIRKYCDAAQSGIFRVIIWQVTSPFRCRETIMKCMVLSELGRTVVSSHGGEPTGGFYVLTLPLSICTSTSVRRVKTCLTNRVHVEITGHLESLDIDHKDQFNEALALVNSLPETGRDYIVPAPEAPSCLGQMWDDTVRSFVAGPEVIGRLSCKEPNLKQPGEDH